MILYPQNPFLRMFLVEGAVRFGVQGRGRWHHPTKSGPGRLHGRVDGTKKRNRRSKIHRACMAGRSNDHTS